MKKLLVAVFWGLAFMQFLVGAAAPAEAKTSSSSSSKDKTEEKQSAASKKKVSVPNPGTKKLPEQKSASPALKKVSTPSVKKSPAPSSTATQKSSSSPAPVASTPAPAVSTPKSNPLKVIPAQKSKSSGFGSASTPKSKSLGKASGGFGSFSKPKSKSPAISPGFGVQPAKKSTVATASAKTPISQKPGGVNNRGTPEEIAQKLHGRIKIVGPNDFWDYVVRFDYGAPDLRVRIVNVATPGVVGEWQIVKPDDNNYDFRVHIAKQNGLIEDLTVWPVWN